MASVRRRRVITGLGTGMMRHADPRTFVNDFCGYVEMYSAPMTHSDALLFVAIGVPGVNIDAYVSDLAKKIHTGQLAIFSDGSGQTCSLLYYSGDDSANEYDNMLCARKQWHIIFDDRSCDVELCKVDDDSDLAIVRINLAPDQRFVVCNLPDTGDAVANQKRWDENAAPHLSERDVIIGSTCVDLQATHQTVRRMVTTTTP